MGVIGGPDGPTVIFITSSPAGTALLALLAAAVVAGAVVFLRKRKK